MREETGFLGPFSDELMHAQMSYCNMVVVEKAEHYHRVWTGGILPFVQIVTQDKMWNLSREVSIYHRLMSQII